MHKLSSLKLSDIEKNEPWLIIGKGPSYSTNVIESFPVERRVGLNHVVEKVKLAFSHIIDLDVVRGCADKIYANATKLILPLYPHENYRPISKPITEIYQEFEILRKLSLENRVIYYNCSTSVKSENGEPIINVKNFSVEGATNILVHLGVKEIRTTGIDGGNTYNNNFSNLLKKTLLSNGQTSFDSQFDEIAKTLMQKPGLIFGPVDIDLPIRVFIGSDKNQYLPSKTLEFSIKSRSSVSVETMMLDDTDVPVPKDVQNRSKTGFSFGRFKIPKVCDYTGHAVYLDADMLVFKDIVGLWRQRRKDMTLQVPAKAPNSQRPLQHSVFIVNCKQAKWNVNEIVSDLDEGKLSYKDLMQNFALTSSQEKDYEIDCGWNSLEHYDPVTTKLLHFTDMPTQPWISYRNQNGHLWYRELEKALESGFILKAEFMNELKSGRVFPGLRIWIFLSKFHFCRQNPWVRVLIDTFSKLLFPRWRAPFRRLK